MDSNDLLKITADIVSEYAATNRLSASELPQLIQSTYQAFSALGGVLEPAEEPVADRPAVTARKSLADRNVIISMIDGKPYAMLKKHLARHGLTPDQYREKFGLKPDYPMTAPGYSERRSELAKAIGLGRNGRGKAPARNTGAKRKLTPSYR